MIFELIESLSSNSLVERVRAQDRVARRFPSYVDVGKVAVVTAVPVVERIRYELFEDFDSTIAVSVVLSSKSGSRLNQFAL